MRSAAPLTVLLASVPASTGLPQAVAPWSGSLLRHADLWTDSMNEAIVTADTRGLRVEVAPGREWAIAAVPGVRIPDRVARIRVHVRDLGGGGAWLMRLYGDSRGTGVPTTLSVFERMSATGRAAMSLDPRLGRFAQQPSLQLQLGLEGPSGAYAVFEGVELVPGGPPPAPPVIPGQRRIEAVDLMPNLPRPFRMRDWRAVAQGYDRLVFDLNAQGRHLPLIWLDDSHINIEGPTFGILSYVGDKRQGGANHEGITGLGAVLSGTLVGIDKSRQEHDWVAMCEAYFNRRNGSNLVLNGMDQGTGGSFWYEIFPHLAFYALADRYPDHPRLTEIMGATADRWREACVAMRHGERVPDFDHTAFDFATMRPVDNGQWREPDAAAGIAWLEYMAWRRFGDPQHLQAADWGLQFLQERQANPYYESLLPWGVYTAARANAELGRHYDVGRLLGWCFGISDCRGGWGATLGNWGGYDCAGLLGSVDNRGGYAFAMNTFVQAGLLVPVARYDPRYARALGKWMLNLANAARQFYPTELPADHQSCPFWRDESRGVVAYEGLRHEWNGRRPYATGDPLVMNWGPETDLGLYGSSYVGFLGALVHRTNDQRILALDCLATEFFRDPAYPTYLIYNPYAEARRVALEVGEEPRDLYDAATHRFLKRGVAGKAHFTLAGDRAAVVVLAPAGGSLTVEGGRTLVSGVVVDYGIGRARRERGTS